MTILPEYFEAKEKEAADGFRSSNFTDGEIKEARKMLDDSSVSSQNRQDLLYMLSNHGELSPNEIDKYAREVGADPEDVKEGGEAPLENAKNARKSLDEANKGKIEDAQEKLDQGGFSNSDEIIDQAKVMVKLFQDFHPRYQKAKGLDGIGGGGDDKPNYVESDLSQGQGGDGSGSGKYSHQGGTPDEIRAGLGEFRGIEFSSFQQDASMLENASNAVDGANESLNRSWQDGTSEWTGDAKQAAQSENQGIKDNAGKLAKALGKAPENIRTVSRDNKNNVVEYAKAVLKLYGDGKVSGLAAAEVDDLIKAHQELPGAVKQLEDKVQELENRNLWDHFVDYVTSPIQLVSGLLGPIGTIIGYALSEKITEDNIHEELEKLKGAQDEVKKKLNDFVNAYDKKVKSFHDQGVNAGEAIQKNYSQLVQQLGNDIGDAFSDKGGDGEGKPGDGGGQDAGGQQQVPTDQQAAVSGGPSQGGGGPSAGGPPPGGGGGGQDMGGGGGGMNPSAAATDPAAAGGQPGAGGAGDAGGANPGTGGGAKPGEQGGQQGDVENPVTGAKAETNPETGEPYPIDPETGEPVKDGAERETLTVEQGDRKLDMVAPDAKGQMEISLGGDDGPGKDFKLDFGNGESGDASDGASGGGQPGEAQGNGADAGSGGAQDFGPQGGGADGAKGEQVYTPGDDGKIHIEEDGVKITAEQPDGPDGPTTVTVEDGNGEPTTYTLGEGQDDSSTSGAGAAGGGVRPDGAAGAAQGPASGGGEPTTGGGASTASAAGPDLGGLGGGGDAPGAMQADAAGLAGGGADGAAESALSGGADGGGAFQGDVSGGDQQGANTQSGDMPGGDGSAGAMQGDLGGDASAMAPAEPGGADPGAGGDAVAGAGGGGDPAEAAAGAPTDATTTADASGGESAAVDDSTSPAANSGESASPEALGGGAGGPAQDSSLADAPGGADGDAGQGGDVQDASDQGESGQDDGRNEGSGGSAAGGGGGMMGAGAGAAGGGDDEGRQSQFVLDAVSELFDFTPSTERISGALGDEPQPVLPFTR